MADVPVFVRIRGARDGSLNAVLGSVKNDVRRLTADVVDTGTKLGTFTGGASLGILALGAAALQTAGKFEQLEAKLNALLKDGEAAQAQLMQSAALAATTPFSVEGIVTATVQLTAYGLRANSVLRQVTDLAAAMGRTVEEASLAVGKAASGSAEGFQSLRDTFGITTAELKKLNVELNTSGGVLLQTPAHVEKARSALLQLIDTKFGGAAQAQSATFEGAMSNLGDSAQLGMNKIGSAILPIATLLTRFAADTIGSFQAIPQPMVAAGVAVGALTAGVLGLVSVATLVGAALLSWYTSLEAAAASSTVAKAAVDRLTTSYVTLSGAVNTATTSQTRFATAARTGGAALGIATAVYIGATIAIKAYEDAQIRAGEAVEQASKKTVNATNRWKLYRDNVNQAAKESGVMVERGGKLSETAEQIAEAFAKSSPATLVAGLEKAGVSLEDVRKEVGAVGDELDLTQSKFEKISRAANAIPDTANPGGILQVSGSSLEDFFPGQTSATVQEVRDKVGQLKFEMEELARTKEIVKQTLGVFEGFAAPLQTAIDHAKRLDSFLSFTKSSKDLQTLRTRLQETTAELRSFEGAARAQGLPTEIAALQRELLTATGTRAEFVKSFLGVLEQQADAETDLAAQVQAAEQSKLAAVERTQAQRKAFSASTTADEKRDAEERLAVVSGSIDKEADLVRQLEQVRTVKRNTPDLAGVDGKLRALELELEGVRKLADEEVKARTEVRDATKRLNEEKTTSAKQAIQDQTDAARELMATLKTDEGGNASAVSGQLDQILTKLNTWESKNKAIVNSSRDVRRSLEQARQAIEGQRAQIRERAQAGRLEEIRQKVTIEVADAEGVKQKLDSIRGAMTQINSERARGLLDAKAAQTELNRLRKEELALTKQIAQEEASKAAAMQGVAVGDLQSEVEYLRARQEAGENVVNALKAKERELLQAKLDAINATAAAERAGGKDRELVEAERIAAIKALLREEAGARLRSHRETNAAIDAEDKKRTGGSSSGTGLGNPGDISGQAYSPGIGTTPLGQKSQRETSVRAPRISVPTPDQMASQMGVGAPSAAQARYDKLKAQGFNVPAPISRDDAKAQTQTINHHDNRQATLNLTMEGGSVADVIASPMLKAAVQAFVEERYRQESFRSGGGAAWP